MQENTILALIAVERDFVQIEAAMNDLVARLDKLPVRPARAAARDLRRLRDGLQAACKRLEAPIDEAASLIHFLEPAAF